MLGAVTRRTLRRSAACCSACASWSPRTRFKGSLSADRAARRDRRTARPVPSRTPRPCCGRSPTAARAPSPPRCAAGYSAADGVRVSGPDGRPVDATVAIDGTTAVVELAAAAGPGPARPAGRSPPRPAGSVSCCAAALDAGARRIVLGIGGSATTDGGAGMLQALGLRLLDADGADVPPGGGGAGPTGPGGRRRAGSAARRCRVRRRLRRRQPADRPEGAAAVFGPQKGASAGGRRRAGRRLDPLRRGAAP